MTKRSDKPLFVISSCLVGERVRYDTQSQALIAHTLMQLEQQYQLVPICPEMAIGLGVPRPPIQLRAFQNGYHAVVIENPTLDYTQALRDYARQILQQYPKLTGVILKQKSPSCGTGKTKLFNHRGGLQRTDGWGIFAKELRKLKPDLIFMSEDTL